MTTLNIPVQDLLRATPAQIDALRDVLLSPPRPYYLPHMPEPPEKTPAAQPRPQRKPSTNARKRTGVR